MEFRPHLNREEIGKITKRVVTFAAASGLAVMSTGSILAESNTTQVPPRLPVSVNPPPFPLPGLNTGEVIVQYPQCGNDTKDRNPNEVLFPNNHTIWVTERTDSFGGRSFTLVDQGVKPGECGNPAPITVYSPLTINEGNSVWSITTKKAQSAQSRFGLSDERQLEAVNAIKNLTAFRNARDLNNLSLGEAIDFPVEAAVDLIFSSLISDAGPGADPDLIRLKQGIDTIANTPQGFLNPEDFINHPDYKAAMEQVNKLLEKLLNHTKIN